LEKRYGEEKGFSLILYPRSQPRGGLKPVGAVDMALSAREDLHRDDRGNVWVVFDLDEHKEIPQSVRRAKAGDIKVAFSTPSFDLWLFLHLAPGIPSFYGKDNTSLVTALRSTKPSFKDYGKDTGSRNKRLDPPQLADLQNTKQAVRLARALVTRCPYPNGRCSPSDIPGEPGHANNCDVLKRDTSTDVYRILELLGFP
jgi:RloB-like protein